MTTKLKRLTDVPGLAAYLGLKVSKVRAMIFANQIPGLVRFDRLIRADLDAIDDWLEELKKKAN
jgi:hypothetical protein